MSTATVKRGQVETDALFADGNRIGQRFTVEIDGSEIHSFVTPLNPDMNWVRGVVKNDLRIKGVQVEEIVMP